MRKQSLHERFNQKPLLFLKRALKILTTQIQFIDTEKTIVREISFVELRNYMEKHRINQIEKKVLLGKSMTIEVRLIICLLPQEIVGKRLRDFPKEHKGKKPSAEFISRSHFNLFITYNIVFTRLRCIYS